MTTDAEPSKAIIAGEYAERYTREPPVYTDGVTKRLVDIDDDALEAARAHLGTSTIKDTVNQALREAADQRRSNLADALSALADGDLEDRSAAWR